MLLIDGMTAEEILAILRERLEERDESEDEDRDWDFVQVVRELVEG